MKKITCGGFAIDEATLEIKMVNGKPTLGVVIRTDGGVGTFFAISPEGKALDDLDMDGYSLDKVQLLSTNSSHPVHVGATVLPAGTPGVKIVGANDDSLAVVKPDSVDEYAPVAAADPMDADHLTTKRYVDEAIERLREELTTK